MHDGLGGDKDDEDRDRDSRQRQQTETADSRQRQQTADSRQQTADREGVGESQYTAISPNEPMNHCTACLAGAKAVPKP